MYIHVPFSESRAHIDILKEMLEFKVILAVIRLPDNANHYTYRITFFRSSKHKFEILIQVKFTSDRM